MLTILNNLIFFISVSKDRYRSKLHYIRRIIQNYTPISSELRLFMYVNAFSKTLSLTFKFLTH